MLPPPAQLQPRIDDITEWLISAARGRETRPPAAWAEADWRYARAIAHIQGIAPMLHARGAGALGDVAWRDHLAAQHARNSERNRRMLALLERVLAGAAALGAPVVPLKGAAHLTALYPDIGLRPMADLDLFTTTEHAPAVESALLAADLHLLDDGKKHRVFALPPNKVVDLRGEHPDNPIKVELHTALVDHVPREVCDLTPMFAAHCSAPGSAPTLLEHTVHALLHASVHMMLRSFRFVTLNELRLLLTRLGSAQAELAQALRELGGLWWAHPPLAMVQRYFPGLVDAALLRQAASAAPPWLRRAVAGMRMTAVSFCNVSPRYVGHVLKWARTPADAGLYVYERLTRAGRTGWMSQQKLDRDMFAFAPGSTVYRRLARWASPRSYRAGAVELFG